jgi:20S proteasome subunit beta 7
MEHEPERWGHPRFDKLIKAKTAIPTSHTQSPVVTGTSVIAVVYEDGVMMAADCLASYGSLARFRDIQRLNTLDAACIIGTSGDIADQQHVIEELKMEAAKELYMNDGHSLAPQQWFHLLQSFQYGRRTKMDPLWNAHIIAGIDKKTKTVFLGFVDLKGTSYRSTSVATGFGAYLAQPLLREATERAESEGRLLSEQEAISLLERCLKVLYCRDARALDRVQMAKVTFREGAVIGQPYKIQTNWTIA